VREKERGGSVMRIKGEGARERENQAKKEQGRNNSAG